MFEQLLTPAEVKFPFEIRTVIKILSRRVI